MGAHGVYGGVTENRSGRMTVGWLTRVAAAGHTHEDAKRFIQHLASELNIGAELTFPVHEDTFHYLWSENRLPVDFNPSDPKLSDSRLSDPKERAMMFKRSRMACDPGWVCIAYPAIMVASSNPRGLAADGQSEAKKCFLFLVSHP